MLPIKRPDFQKGGKTTPNSQAILMRITPRDSTYRRNPLQLFQAPVYKNVEFCGFLLQEILRKCGYLFLVLFFFSPTKDCLKPIAREDRERAHLNEIRSYSALSDQKDKRVTSPHPTPLFLQRPPIKILNQHS